MPGTVSSSIKGRDCTMSAYKHAQCRNKRDDFEKPPKGEEDVPKHRERVASTSMAASAQM